MATCSICNTENTAGTRWCNICHTNMLNPKIGKLASPSKRLGAFFIDMFATLVSLFMLIYLINFLFSEETDGNISLIWVTLLIIILSLIYFFFYISSTITLCKRGSSFGKDHFGLSVIKEDGSKAGFFTMLIRGIFGKAMISGTILSLGFLWILFDKDNQGWHDKLMSTYVVDKS
jgi:uncharacterized RDD family membrane protein YckC